MAPACAHSERPSRGAEATLPHQEDERRAERDGEGAADQERQVEGDGGEERAREHPEEGSEVVCLLATQVDPAEVFPAQFVRDPGLQGAADERVAGAPDKLRGQDRREGRQRPLEGEARPDQQETQDHRATAAVGVGQHARGYLEDQDGELQRRPHEHELQRVQADGLYPVDRRDGRIKHERQPEGHVDKEVDGVRSRAVHRVTLT